MWRWLARLLGRVPDLYPKLDPQALCTLLDEAEFRRLMQLRRLVVFTLASETSSDEERHAGEALAHVLRRDLMLVRELSVLGSEDTGRVLHEAVSPEALDDYEIIVTGHVSLAGGRARVSVEIHEKRLPTQELALEGAGLVDLPGQLAAAVVEAVGLTPGPGALAGWQTGRPASTESLLGFGRVAWERAQEDSADAGALLALRARDPGFVVPMHLFPEDDPRARKQLLRALADDPNDAPLCFQLFAALWNGRGHQREAMQFIRRTLELAPGHGKAHMCAPHAAAAGADMIRHSELGVRLLPGNAFALNNLYLYLQRRGGAPERLRALAEAGIEADPADPANYDRLIELCEKAGDYDTALSCARTLAALYGPPMNPRTRYCVEQNPVRRDALRAGKLDLVGHTQARIERLATLAADQGGDN